MYIIRLDDASDYMDVAKWGRMEELLDRYSVRPIVGIIPKNENPQMTDVYPQDPDFWGKAAAWREKGWRIALHGYHHVYKTSCAGINPVNAKSEFAGVPLDEQKEMIRDGFAILCEKGLKPDTFFAPSHTFDENTVEALRSETDIRIISDTIANDVYFKDGFYYIPQQTGKARSLPFRVTTICLHPNTMKERTFADLEEFLKKNRKKLLPANEVELKKRSLSLCDRLLRAFYFKTKKAKR